MTIVLGSVVILLTFALGGLLAFFFSRLDRAVTDNYAMIESESKGYNPALTMGFEIDGQAPAEKQIAEARKQAAKLAASLPRGANSRIGYSETPGGRSASKGVAHDPWTASKIAEFHGWDGVQTGIPSGGVPVAPVAAAPTATAAAGKIELVPGKDYPYIEITDDMADVEKRKARIANSKAKSAAMKAAKAGGVTAAAATPVAVAATPVAAAAVGIEAPNLIEITDDMPDDEKRKARIANSKAKSAFNKALKAAGIDPKAVEIDKDGNVVLPQSAAPAAAVVPAESAPAAAVPTAVNIEAPNLIDITDDMPDDEKRKARIANSKAKSAFNKALKAAGIDPKSVEIDEDGKVIIAGESTPGPAEKAEAAARVAEPTPVAESGEVNLASLNLEPPKLIEITDDMSPDEIRQARIANSKAKSAFNKALKAAGIDPKDVKY